MLKKSFNSLPVIWFAGLLVTLPLVLTLASLAWVVSPLNRFIGPSSPIGRDFAVIGQSPAGDSPLAYLLGTALLLVAIYLLGLGIQLGLKWPLTNLLDLTLRRIPLIDNLYNLAGCFVGLLGKKQDADTAAMSPVWCFFGGNGAAVLALIPNPEAVELDGRAHYATLVPTAPILVDDSLLYVLAEWVKLAQIGIDTFISICALMGITSPPSLAAARMLVEPCAEQSPAAPQVVLRARERGVHRSPGSASGQGSPGVFSESRQSCSYATAHCSDVTRCRQPRSRGTQPAWSRLKRCVNLPSPGRPFQPE